MDKDKPIQVQCECGRILKVPGSRAGQKGKCKHCGLSVIIPYENDFPNIMETSQGNGSSEIDKQRMLNKTIRKAPPKTVVKTSPKVAKSSSKAVKTTTKEKLKQKKGKKKSTKSKKRARKNRLKAILIFLSGLLAGFCLGVAVGPDYLDLLPSKEKASETDVIKDHSMKNKNTNEHTINQKYIDELNKEINMQDKEANKQYAKNSNKTTDTEYNHAKVIDVNPSSLRNNKNQIQNKLKRLMKFHNVLYKEYSIVNAKNERLFKKHKIRLSQVDTLLSKALKKKHELKKCIDFSKIAYNNQDTNLVKRALKNLEEYKYLNVNSSPLLHELKKAERKIDEDYEEYNSFYQNFKYSTQEKYLGEWYRLVKKEIRNFGRLSKHLDVGKHIIKIDAIKRAIMKVKKYPQEVNAVVTIFKDATKKKKLVDWLKYQREATGGNRHNAPHKIVEEFFVKGKKFIIKIDSDIKKLQYATHNLKNSYNNAELIDTILRVLRKIERTFRRRFTKFKSGAISFQYWKS